jgi:hypothetical protein
VIAFAALAVTTPAGAQVTVGQVATKEDFGVCGFTFSEDEVVTVVAAGASYAVPPPGSVITSWATTSWISKPTNVAGTATSAQTFTYEGCMVPKLRGKKLKAPKKTPKKRPTGPGR